MGNEVGMQGHVTEWIDEYLDAALSPEVSRRFEQHVVGCRSCERSLREIEDARSCLRWLSSPEAPPSPGPEFYIKVQQSIEQKMDPGFWGHIGIALHGPRLAYPLVFLFLGLLLTAWGTALPNDWTEAGVLDIPPAQYSAAVSEAEMIQNREMVMISLVETSEGD